MVSAAATLSASDLASLEADVKKIGLDVSHVSVSCILSAYPAAQISVSCYIDPGAYASTAPRLLWGQDARGCRVFAYFSQ